jgi:very-short-patch-repair endonuclease
MRFNAFGPSNGWELKTREILREALPEYDVDPHMRLANVVKGRIPDNFAMAGYEVDFTVREKGTGYVLCAIELDGWQHNTKNGQRKDANKNRWLREARIKLIRIKSPEEAVNIHELMRQPDNFETPQEKIYSFEKKAERASKNNAPSKFVKYIISVIGVIAFFSVVMNFANIGAQKTINSLGKNAHAEQQKLQQQNNQRIETAQTEAKWHAEQEAMQAAARQRIEAAQPHYEQRVVKGKSVRECQVDGVITNESIRCMKNHYETVLVSGNQ